MKYCKCGCKILIKDNKQFVSGHNNNIVYKLSNKLTKINLKKLYFEQNLSATKIAKKYGVSSSTIILLCKKYGIKTRTNSQAQHLYLKYNNNRSEKQSLFMKKNNPMNNLESRKKCSRSGKRNPMWNGGEDVECPNCGKTRYLKPSRLKSLILKGICWDCHRHSKHRSSIEIKVAKELKRREIDYQEEVPFHGMFLDFVLPNKIVIECDGAYWHSLPENKQRDIKKENLLKQEGYKLYRLVETDINNDVISCVEEVVLNGK